MNPDVVRQMLEEGRHLVPDRYRPGLERYFIDRIEPGAFLCSVLANDLRQAVLRADDPSLATLRSLLLFLYNFAPAQGHGSREAFQLWLSPPETSR